MLKKSTKIFKKIYCNGKIVLKSLRQESSKKRCFSRIGNTREVSIGRQRFAMVVCQTYHEHLPLISSRFWLPFLLFFFLLSSSLSFFFSCLPLSGSSSAGRLVSEMKEQVFTKESPTDDRRSACWYLGNLIYVDLPFAFVSVNR